MKILFRIWITITALLGILAIVGAGAILGSYFLEYRAGAESYIQLSELVQPQEPAEDVASDQEAPESVTYRIDFDGLKKINSDVVGWIIVPDTNINYPIVKRENNNDFYLSHLFDKSENIAGCIFLDTRCSLEDTHAIIHGHNMADGSMFRSLSLFKDRDFFLQHPYYYILTPEENYKVEIFAGSVVRIDYPVWQLDFSGPADIQSWQAQCRASASVSRDMELSPEDQIITLSTCTYEYRQARWIVQGKLTRADPVHEGTIQDLLQGLPR